MLRERAAIRVDTVDGLAGIADRGVALAIHERRLPAELATAIDAIDLRAVDPLFVSVRIGDAEAVIAAGLAAAGYPAALHADIVMLADRFAAIMGVGTITVRLEPIATDACRKFHADYVTVRLLTTYAGRATQWFDALTPDAVNRLGAGDVALFKGRMLADPPPVLHRSPPIAGTGERRLLLVIDPVHAN